MLKTLSDLFLLISTDTKKITNQDLSIFYNFIIKKIPKIEQQFPLMISKSFPNDISQNTKKENNKKFFIHFQKQVYNLLIELIEFCYKEKIIKLNNEIEKYLSQLKSKDNKNIEMQKFLIYLIINNKVNCNIYPKDYLKFFNTENKTKKRIIAERFLNFSNNLIKIYKDNKKNIKIVSNTEKKISNSKKILILEKKNQTLEKNDGLCMGMGIKFFEEKFEMLKDKIKGRLLNEKKNLNLINPSKNLSSSDNDIIDNNDDEISSDCNKEKYKDELDDTISCETPKNISIDNNKKKIINDIPQRKTFEKINYNNSFDIKTRKIYQSQNLNISNRNLNDKDGYNIN